MRRKVPAKGAKVFIEQPNDVRPSEKRRATGELEGTTRMSDQVIATALGIVYGLWLGGLIALRVWMLLHPGKIPMSAWARRVVAGETDQ